MMICDACVQVSEQQAAAAHQRLEALECRTRGKGHAAAAEVTLLRAELVACETRATRAELEVVVMRTKLGFAQQVDGIHSCDSALRFCS